MWSPGIVFGLLLLPSALPERKACLHDAGEVAEQRERRRGALTAVRMINSTQLAALLRTGEFRALGEMFALPPGFRATLSRGDDRKSYLLSAKDTEDPCGFAYFSDESGLIYEGQVIRPSFGVSIPR